MQDLKYYIKNPDKSRRSFSIVCYTEKQKQREYLKFKDPRVAAVNLQFKQQALTFAAARTLIEEIIKDLERPGLAKSGTIIRAILSAENQKLLHKFWDYKYAERILVDERSARQDFERALMYLGTVSLYSGTSKDLTMALKKRCNNSQHRRAADRLNEMLKFLKREIKLAKPNEDFKTIVYLTEDEVMKLAEAAPIPELKWLTLTLFGTGARLGEALALTPTDIKSGIVHINKQLKFKDSILKIAPPKRNKSGPAPIISSTRDAVISWAKVPNKHTYREPIYDFIVSTSARLWSDKNEKHISPHDLRHSYAIHLLSKDISLERVAKSLRNRFEVCEKYYTGYAHTNQTLEAVKQLI